VTKFFSRCHWQKELSVLASRGSLAQIHWTLFDYSSSWFLSISPSVTLVHGWSAPSVSCFHVEEIYKGSRTED
jgi:hypothetical protein